MRDSYMTRIAMEREAIHCNLAVQAQSRAWEALSLAASHECAGDRIAATQARKEAAAHFRCVAYFRRLN